MNLQFHQNGLQTASTFSWALGFSWKLIMGDAAISEGVGLESLPEKYPLSDTGEHASRSDLPRSDKFSLGKDGLGI